MIRHTHIHTQNLCIHTFQVLVCTKINFTLKVLKMYSVAR